LDVLEEREAHLGSIVQNLSLEGRMIQTGGPIFEALINLYGSQGRFEEALATFETIIGRIDVACLRAMLLACSMVSPARWTDAITILHSCDVVETASGPGKVDQVALGNAIMACAKANEFGEGLNLLQLYGVPERKR
jgi:pentatricopeptide repeat protein